MVGVGPPNYRNILKEEKTMEITLHIPEMGQLAEAIRFHADQAGARLYAQIAAEAPVTAAPAQAPTAAAQAPTVPAQPVVAPVQVHVAPVHAPVAPVTTIPTQPQVPVAPTLPQPPQAPVPTQMPGYQLEDIMRAAAVVADKGKRQEVLALMAQFQIPALNLLPPERFSDFAQGLRGLGAQI